MIKLRRYTLNLNIIYIYTNNFVKCYDLCESSGKKTGCLSLGYYFKNFSTTFPVTQYCPRIKHHAKATKRQKLRYHFAVCAAF